MLFRPSTSVGNILKTLFMIFFMKPAYERAYINLIYPVPSPHDGAKTDTPDIDPPKFTKHPDMPKKSRRKATDEPSQSSGRVRMTTITCSNCHEKGHKYTSYSQMLRPDPQIKKTKHKSNINMLANFSHQQNHEGLPAGMARGRATKLTTMRGRSGARRRGRGKAKGYQELWNGWGQVTRSKIIK